MARPPRWHATLDASVDEACLAVRLYNDPAEPRCFEAFPVHMHLAWLYLIHACFSRDGVDFRYWDPTKKRRLVRIDGEPKRWELQRSVEEHWPDGGPVSANLDFFIRLRNRFEHRHATTDAALLLAVAGHAHALLVNYEEELTAFFGPERSLATRLRFPVFVGTFTPGGEQALRRLRKTLPKEMQKFLTDYYAGLDEATANDPRFEFRLRASLELSPRDPDATAIQFTNLADMTEEERAVVEEMGRKGGVVIREQTRPVSGHGLLLPAGIVNEVQSRIPFWFAMHHFVGAYRRANLRPPTNDPHPERTRQDFCIYDAPSGQYRYTSAFANWLVKKCKSEKLFEETTGYRAKLVENQGRGLAKAQRSGP